MRKINFGSKLSLELLLTDLKRKKNDDWLPFPVLSSRIVVTVCLVFKKISNSLTAQNEWFRTESAKQFTLHFTLQQQ